MPNTSVTWSMRSHVSPSEDRLQGSLTGISVARPVQRSEAKPIGRKTVTADASATSSSVDYDKRLYAPKITRGVPSAPETIPKGLQQYDIIKHYPNHLHGELLLNISTFWQPKEISKLSGIKANTLVKRIRVAKVKYRGEIVMKKKERRETSKSDRNRQIDENRNVVTDGQGTLSSSFVCGQQPLPIYPTSEASSKFLMEQTNHREDLIKEQKEAEARGHQRLKGRNGQWYFRYVKGMYDDGDAGVEAEGARQDRCDLNQRLCT